MKNFESKGGRKREERKQEDRIGRNRRKEDRSEARLEGERSRERIKQEKKNRNSSVTKYCE